MKAYSLHFYYTELLFIITIGVIYYFSNLSPANGYDQTFTIAKAFLDGSLGVADPRPWLELVPGEELHYSVFPLGAVLSMIPFAILAKMDLITYQPSATISALIASGSALFSLLLCNHYQLKLFRRLLYTSFLLLGSWMWCNLVFGGAWQIALGIAVFAQLGMIYFLLVRKRLVLAGFFYALAFGNRTELVTIIPFLCYLVIYPNHLSIQTLLNRKTDLIKFFSFPSILLLSTFIYNYARFYSIFDMGYEKIPFVFDQGGFENGLLSIHAIESNFMVMILTPLRIFDKFPYIIPHGFGESIFLCSPFLFLIFNWKANDIRIKVISWISIVILTFSLWIHGNTGAYQYGYRYGMILLPWFLLLLLEGNNSKMKIFELPLFVVSFYINLAAVYSFYWAHYV